MRSAVLLGTAAVALALLAGPAQAHHTPVPSVVALVGSLQSELGCPGDWQPECAQTRLQPVAGSPGVFRGTFDVPAGPFEYKVALNGTWDENYGAGGAPGGSNIPLEAPGGPITFTYDHATHVISDDAPVVLGRVRAAHWLRRGLFAWDAPDAASYRLHVAPEGGLEVVDGTIPGDSYAADARPARRCRATSRTWPPSTPSSCPRPGVRAARELLTGQLIVAAYDAGGELVGFTGVQIPGVLDDLYASAAHARLGPTWHGRTPKLAVWAPTAKDVQLVLGERRLAMRRGRDGVWRIEGRPSWRDAAYAYAVTVYVPDEVVTNVVTDPYSLGAHASTRAARCSSTSTTAPSRTAGTGCASRRSISPRTRRSTSSTSATSRSPTRPCPPAHRGTYLAFTDDRSDGMRHLRRLADSGLNTLHLLPSNDIATIEEDRSEQQEPPCDLPVLPARLRASSRRASSRSATPTASTGATTRCTTRRPRAPTPTRARRRGAHARVPRDGQGHQPRRPARGDGRRLQPHAGRRPGPEVDPRPDRPRLLPPARRRRARSRPPPAARTPRPSTA